MARPKKNETLPGISDSSPLNWVDTLHSHQKIYDIEKSKKEVIARSNKAGGKKSVSFSINSQKMGNFLYEIRERKKRGLSTRAWAEPEALETAVDDFLAFMMESEMRPYVEGLCLWLGIDKGTYNAILTCGDERSTVLKQFELTLGFFSAQTISSTEGNPVGDIYLDKSRLGYNDQHDRTLNINVNPGQQLTTNTEELTRMIVDTPDDYIDVDEYEEVDD